MRMPGPQRYALDFVVKRLEFESYSGMCQVSELISILIRSHIRKSNAKAGRVKEGQPHR